MKNLLIIFTVLFICSPRDSNAQVNQEWVKRYSSPGSNDDYAFAMTFDAAGNVYVTGKANGDMATIKYSPSGTLLWQAIYAGPANDADEGDAICVDGAGNVYVTGRSFGNNSQNDFATIKYDPSGNELWVQRYNGTANDEDRPYGIAVDASGNVYAGGWSSATIGGINFALVKYSPQGSQLWVKFYNGTGGANDFAYNMTTDSQGNIYLTGSSMGTSSMDYATVKFNTSGTMLWAARYEGSSTDEPAAVTVDRLGNVYVTGKSYTSSTAQDIATVKYNNAGVQQWVKKYNRTGSVNDAGTGITVDSTGLVFVSGYSNNSTDSTYEYTILSYDANGNQVWVRHYNGGSDNSAFSIDIDKYGSIYVTGRTKDSGNDYDFATIKYSGSGTQQWIKLYESPLNGSDNGRIVKADDNGNVYVTGYATGSFSGYDYLTVKYSQPIGITPISTEVPGGFALGQNYPNPFNPTTNIKLQIAHSGFVSVKVYDIAGKEVAVLVSENLSAGVYNVDFDASQLSSGTYFYRIVSGSFTDVKKMIIVK